MKLLGILFLLFTLNSYAAINLSNIESIDELPLPPAAEDATDEALPYEEIQELLETDKFTVISTGRAVSLFNELKKNPNARNRVAGGKCAIRSNYIENYLAKKGISSGSLYINCPSNNGRLRLIDQVTGRRYTFTNFHDTNIVSTTGGYRVMDVQFKSGPVTLSSYLAGIEASQKLKPLKNRSSSDRGYCYWNIRN